MTDDSTDAIEDLDQQIDDLRDRIESCRKGLIVSQLAASLGGLWLIAALLGFLPSVEGLLLSLAACLGGAVGMGTNVSSRRQAEAELTEQIAERNALIDRLNLRSLQ
jgi:hypothetical protein